MPFLSRLFWSCCTRFSKKVIAHSYPIKSVIQLSKNISGLIPSTCSYAHIHPPSFSTLYIGLLKNRRKINPHSKTFFLVAFSAPTYQVAENNLCWAKYFLILLKNSIKNPSRAVAREGTYKYLLLYKNKDTVWKQIALFSYGVLCLCCGKIYSYNHAWNE